MMLEPAGPLWPFGALTPGRYDLVMIDVAWPWITWSEAGAKKSPSSQYTTMDWDMIRSLPVARLLRPGGVAWVWFTWPLIATVPTKIVEQSWGLTVKTGGDWAKRTRTGKLRWGPGHIFRSVCEPFCIAINGDGGGPRGPSVTNLIETMHARSMSGLAREHSRKPDEAYLICETLMPHAAKADVYARQPRKGWWGFGDELHKFSVQP